MSTSSDFGRMDDKPWAMAFHLLESAEQIAPGQRRRFVESATDDPAVLKLVFDIWGDECAEAASPSTAPLPAPGEQIGRYEIVAKLASGGMGQIYSARDLELDRMVALKFLSDDLLAKPGAAEQIIHEARAASALNHAHIVTVYEILRCDGRAAIAMELVDGLSLRDFCSDRAELSQVLEWMRQAASALAMAHAKGIVHRDIKPENIMLRTDGAVKILDFGMARRVVSGAQDPSHGTHGGTLRYFSPEQARGEPATTASDIFALGTVLYELIEGRHPFASDSPLATLHSIMYEEPARLAHRDASIPKPMERLMLAMLAKDPAARPTAAAVTGALAQHLSALGTRPKLRRSYAVALIALAALVLGWFTWNRFNTRELSLRQITLQLPDNRVTTGTISPDGRHLAYATIDGVFLQNMGNGETRLLRSPADFWVSRIRWLSDGKRLLVGGFSRTSLQPSIWIGSTAGADPILFRDDAYDPEPSADSRTIAFTNKLRTEVWTCDPAGANPRRVFRLNGRLLHILYWSADSTHLALATHPVDGGSDPTAEPGRFGILGEHNGFASLDLNSGKIDIDLRGLDMGWATVFRRTRLLFIGSDPENRAAGHSLWQMDIDAHTAGPAGAPHRLALKSEWIGDVSASADGREVTVVHQRSAPTVYVADYSAIPRPALTHLRQLTLDASSSFPHAWTPDSQRVVFESDRGGTNDLFFQQTGSRIAQPLVASSLEDFQANAAPDHKTFLFIQSPPGRMLPAAIMRVPIGGGRAEQVLASGAVDEFRCPLVGGNYCVGRTTQGRETFTFWELDPYRGLGRRLARTKWETNVYGDWALSPDGAEIAIPSHRLTAAKIRLIRLNAPLNGPPESEIQVDRPVSIAGLNWTADGKGWFATLPTSGGSKLAFIDRAGRVTLLLEHANYAVPSPDGKHAAVAIIAVTSNIWAVDGL